MYYFKGDLNQAIVQEAFLKNECVGFDIVWQTGYFPHFKTKEDYIRALFCFWLDKPLGWWNYKDDMLAHGVCTHDHFMEELETQVLAKREREAS